jgi:hypothetical protein
MVLKADGKVDVAAKFPGVAKNLAAEAELVKGTAARVPVIIEAVDSKDLV